METRTIQGVEIPALGLGTWQLTDDDCVRAVETALELGYRHIDTAQMYGNEAEIGRALAASGVDRDELFLTTKLWNDNLRHADVLATTEESLDRLGTDWIDLLLIHWPHPSVPLEETLGAMEELRDAGKVRHLGVSNFPPSWLETALELAPVICNQVEYHPFLSQETLLEMCRTNDLLLTAYSPLARGQVTRDRMLQEIGEAHGKSAAQITIRWLLQQDPVAVIPKATSRDHLEANLEVFDFELSEDEMARIAELDRGDRRIDPSFAPDWER